MSDSWFVLAIDVGEVLLKGVVLQRDAAGRQRILWEDITEAAPVETGMEDLLQRMASVVAIQAEADGVAAGYDLVLVGHPPDLAAYAAAAEVARYSHEEALLAVARRQSADGTVLVLDIGSHRTMAALGRYGKVSTASFDFGVGSQAWNFVRKASSAEQVMAWLPFDINEEAITDYVATKSLNPGIIPSATAELAIEQSVAKMILRQIEHALPIPWDDVRQVIVSGGVLSQPAHAPQTVATYLDGMQPQGMAQLVSDESMLVFALGGAFEHWSAKDYSVGRALLRSCLTAVGTLVCLAASPAEEEKQRLAKITLDTGLSTEQALEVRMGEVAVIPWAADEEGEVSLKGGKMAGGKTDGRQVIGGSVGLVIDGRSRPMLLPNKERERKLVLLNWDKQLNVHGQVGVIGQEEVA